jgi:thermitase
MRNNTNDNNYLKRIPIFFKHLSISWSRPIKFINGKLLRKATRLFVFVLLFTLVLLATFANSQNNPYIKENPLRQYVDNEILVKFRDDVDNTTIMNTVKAMGNEVKRDIENRFGKTNLLQMKLQEGQSVEEAVAEYGKRPEVEYAQPNYIYKILATVPNDPSYSNLWGLHNVGQTIPSAPYSNNNPGTTGMDMDMERAWDVLTDASAIIVAVLDSGLNYNHEDLFANMWIGATHHGYDFVDNDDDPMDLNGHGTHCAGTIGAIGNNFKGTTGVCWEVQIMAVRGLDAAGSGTTANIISGVYYAVDHGAKIISMSIGGSNYDQAYYNAIGYAKNYGVLVIAAAGNDGVNNDGGTHTYPCDFDHDNIIGVAALDQSFVLASFSNYGSLSVDVGAPGTNILSEWHQKETVISDALNSGWTEGGTNGWAYGVYNFGSGNVNLLMDPATWPSGYYINNANDRIWKTFNISGYNAAVLNYYIWLDVESGYDGFNTYCRNGTTDPFVGGTQLAGWTGSTGGYFYLDSFVIPTNCLTSNCTIGFRLQSDSSYAYRGAAIGAFSIKASILNNQSYNTINGTSMATPHVSGLAALIWVLNTQYGYQDVKESILNGGKSAPALNGKTTSGKAVNGWGSLRYIKPPTGLVISEG